MFYFKKTNSTRNQTNLFKKGVSDFILLVNRRVSSYSKMEVVWLIYVVEKTTKLATRIYCITKNFAHYIIVCYTVAFKPFVVLTTTNTQEKKFQADMLPQKNIFQNTNFHKKSSEQENSWLRKYIVWMILIPLLRFVLLLICILVCSLYYKYYISLGFISFNTLILYNIVL